MSAGAVAALTAAYDAGATTPQTQVEGFLTAGPVGGDVDAFVSVSPDAVRRQAERSGDRLTARRPRGPLEGVLVGVKDFIHVGGHATRVGTSRLVEQPATDAVLVRRLREAGAIIAGKTRMTELGLSPLGVNPSDRSPRNPHDLARPTGGSSSGSAAAVAAGLVPLAVGSDGGGSLRIPPALCGVVGLKPTYGAVDPGGELTTGWWSLNTTGPIGRTVADVALAFSVMADRAPLTADADRPVRVGVDWSWWGVPHSAVDRVCREALGALQAEVVEIPHLELAQAAGYATIAGEVATAMEPHTRDGFDGFGPDVELQLRAFRTVTAVEYLKAQQIRTLLARGFAAALSQVDVIVTPTTAVTAPRLADDVWTEGVVDEELVRALTRYTLPANLAGLPALAVPVGNDGDGLPVSLQLVAGHGREDVLLGVGARLEREGVAAARRPPAWFGGDLR